jgi:hypothetical protein
VEGDVERGANNSSPLRNGVLQNVTQGLRIAVSNEHGNKSGSIKGGEFLDYLSDLLILKKDSAPWSYLLRTIKRRIKMLQALN